MQVLDLNAVYYASELIIEILKQSNSDEKRQKITIKKNNAAISILHSFNFVLIGNLETL